MLVIQSVRRFAGQIKDFLILISQKMLVLIKDCSQTGKKISPNQVLCKVYRCLKITKKCFGKFTYQQKKQCVWRARYLIGDIFNFKLFNKTDVTLKFL